MSTSSTLDCSLPIVASALFLDNFFVAADIGEVFPLAFSLLLILFLYSLDILAVVSLYMRHDM